MNDSILAWHWVSNNLYDGTPVPIDGQVLRYGDGPLVICQFGLHASINPWDALQYAPGPILCRVRCSGIGDQQTDKFVCSERTILARRDMTEPIKYFARMQALSVIDNWQIDPPQIVLDWLMTGDGSLRSAAEAAAWSAAQPAAQSAAQLAARSAARSAAQSAAQLAAHSAARSAAQSAAHSAARSAAEAAAWSAAWSAALSAARAQFNQLVQDAFE